MRKTKTSHGKCRRWWQRWGMWLPFGAKTMAFSWPSASSSRHFHGDLKETYCLNSQSIYTCAKKREKNYEKQLDSHDTLFLSSFFFFWGTLDTWCFIGKRWYTREYTAEARQRSQFTWELFVFFLFWDLTNFRGVYYSTPSVFK